MTVKSNNTVYVCLYMFPNDNGRQYLNVYDNADAAIECINRAKSYGAYWDTIQKTKAASDLKSSDGLPESEVGKNA